MKTKYIVFFSFFLLLGLNVLADKPKTKHIRINGYIFDTKTKETLIGATIYDMKSRVGTTSNNYGFYSLSVNEGTTELFISYIGYEKLVLKYNFTIDTTINIFIKPSSATLEEVVIEDRSVTKRFIEDPTPGKITINPITITSLPSLTGESDLLKSLQMLPGVKSGTEGTTGLYVRGGNMDQNLYLVDGNPIYNPNHLMGFISTFNTDAIKNIEFFKGAFPASYGGRVSSVVDVRMKDGNNEKIQGQVGIGLISAKLSVEGPIIKDKTTFSISGRRTYIDILTKPLVAYLNQKNDSDVDFAYFFSDINLKINHKFSPSNRITASLYWGEDKFKFSSEDKDSEYSEKSTANVKWGNLIGTIDWAYEINNRLFSNLSFSYNRYRSNMNSIFERNFSENGSQAKYQFDFDFLSGIEDWSAKNNYNFYLNGWNSINFGINYTYHTYSPEITSVLGTGETTIDEQYNVNNRVYGNEIVFYVEDQMNFTEKFSLNPGIHYNLFKVGKTTYHSFQPRLGMRYSLFKNLSLKAGYAMMNQNIHLLANGILSLPTDLWVPVTQKIAPITSHQISGGVFYQLKDWANLSFEAYYKKLNNVIDYKDGISSFNSSSDKWEEKVAQGKGEAYGMEFLVQRDKGKTTGWISYTLSWAFREYPNGEINAGKRFYDRYDSRHQFNIVITHEFNDKIDATAAWVYNSGNRVSVPIASYYDPHASGEINQNNNFTPPNIIEVYGERNNYIMPAYHRLDLSLNFHKKKKHGIRTWSINIYNVYNRKNAFIIMTASEPNKLKAYSIMPIIPTVSYTYKFN
ncbi:MAG: TonB-dependent receptor [Bacteroidales bacterium]|nr:TonB-dependent receptor [Bacteroidales bacterium]MDD4001520.1 TonB-dependent receptor [Bacteroidales bacterium]MDD4528937.1 TonB-dependent receptor [Bacteroidales bacterium]MDD4830130.1 TonB-dependent receptor [Bacteroidales bacterium]